MSRVLPAFLDELEKCSGALSRVGKFVWKHPILAGGIASTVGTTGLSAAQAYKKGRKGGQKARYLHAAIDPLTGDALASRAAYTNYNKLFPGKPTKKQLKKLHGKYKEDAF